MKFKNAVLAYGKPEVLRAKVDEILGQKQQKVRDDAIADAVAKAKAEPRGLMGLFG